MQTLQVTKENEAKVLKALGDCALFRALKPEQLAQLQKAAELDGKPSKEFTLDEMRKAIRLDGKRQVTVNREGKRLKLAMELVGGRESLMAPVAGAGVKPAPRRPA